MGSVINFGIVERPLEMIFSVNRIFVELLNTLTHNLLFSVFGDPIQSIIFFQHSLCNQNAKIKIGLFPHFNNNKTYQCGH